MRHWCFSFKWGFECLSFETYLSKALFIAKYLLAFYSYDPTIDKLLAPQTKSKSSTFSSSEIQIRHLQQFLIFASTYREWKRDFESISLIPMNKTKRGMLGQLFTLPYLDIKRLKRGPRRDLLASTN
jgi:hypothetical protein